MEYGAVLFIIVMNFRKKNIAIFVFIKLNVFVISHKSNFKGDMDEYMPDFLIEADEAIAALNDDLIRLEGAPDDRDLVNGIFRTLHGIKGTSGFLGLSRLGDVCQEGESVLGRLRDGALRPTSCVIALLLRCGGAMQNILDTIAATGDEGSGTDGELIAELRALRDRSTSPDTQETMLDAGALQALFVATPGPRRRAAGNQTVRVDARALEALTIAGMQPIGAVWAGLPRLARDLARKLGKKIELVMEGADTPLDHQVLKAIKNPLIQMIRNAADHGLETPQVRSALGKPETGQIRLSAISDSGNVVIRMTDDGRGLDLAAIRRKAVESGLVDAAGAASMTDENLFRFILRPGFSTAAEITGISGRGVGMDVVRTNIERIGGGIDIASSPNRGAAFVIKIPIFDRFPHAR